MRCPRCGTELRIMEEDKFCYECGFPLKITTKDGESVVLKSFFLDVDSGVMYVNGKEINNVTAFSLKFEDGKYGLCITHEDPYEASAPFSIAIGAS